MIAKVFLSDVYQEGVKRTTDKEKELLRLIKVKSEKMCNNFLLNDMHTQLSYLTKEEQDAAVAVPKEILLNKIIAYLQSI